MSEPQPIRHADPPGPGPIEEITRCRACDAPGLISLFSLGDQYVSDFVASPEDARRGIVCPIELVLCPSCTLVQQRYTAPQTFMYTRHYWYRSGVTATMRAALDELTNDIQARVRITAGDVVLDLGSNDGTLLRTYSNSQIIRVGVEPASNLADEGRKGIDLLIEDFWGYDAYRRAMLAKFGQCPQAKVITAIGMLYDLPDPNPFIADVAKALADDGLFVCQFMALKQTVLQGDVGNFAHEHLEFYSLMSIVRLFEKNGLELIDVSENVVNGGSYRLFARRARPSGRKEVDLGGMHRIIEAFKAETELGLDRPWTYTRLHDRMDQERSKCVTAIKGLVADGKKVWVYGASTKGNVILQWYGLDGSLMTAAADRSFEKVGRYTVGTAIPIVSEQEARLARPDAYLVLPYAFMPEFKMREKDWLRMGGKFLVPLPTFRIVTSESEE